MLILVTYDIDTTTPSGAHRLHRVAKRCLRYSVRVQGSVFECRINHTQYTCLKHELQEEIDPSKDSVRFYRLGDHAQNKVESLGIVKALDPEGTLVL